MIGKWTITLDRVTDYTKQADGSWHADLHRPIRLHVEGRSPDDCRYQMASLFDAALTEWLERIQEQPGVLLGSEAGAATNEPHAASSR